ncbi:hypothetical protein [Paenibacillus apiarius]|uniref:hypothetical protein n=1 Tax=Paenibacillus apiarius TaxID=46240 RepID=UPI003B3A29AC
MPVGAATEELELIKSYVLLPMILSVFERDSNVIKESVKTPGPYTEMITRAMDCTTKVLSEVRREFRKRGIKVYEVTRDDTGVRAEFVCRGYTGNFRMLWALITAEVGVRMRAYMGLSMS